MLSRLLPQTILCCRNLPTKNGSSTYLSSIRMFKQDSSTCQKVTKRSFSTAQRFNARGAKSFAQKKISGTTAITVGQISLAGGSLVGLGALCYYGLGLGNEAGIIDKAALWPEYIRHRVRDTYLYFGGALLATAGSALAIAKNPTMMRLVSANGMWSIVLSLGAMIGTSMICRSIEYKPGIGAKQIAWLIHAGVVGAVIAPLTMLGGPLLIRAAWYTAGVVGGLSAVAMCAPSEKFLNMGGPLAAGLGVVFMASLGSAFFPPTNALGLGLYSISMYGGLLLFSVFLLHDTQRIVKKAETHPGYSIQPYDPVNASMSIYMDTINIFIRIAMLMAGNRKK